MSALHRNALLDERARCLICAEPVTLPADYCPRCVAPDASAYAPVAEMSGRTVSITVAAIALIMAAYNIANWSI